MQIDVCFTANALKPCSVSGKLAVVIDVFRTTTTIATALARGAEKIVPVSSRQEADRALRNYPDALLAGEFKGQRIKGFHLGNSPLEFTQDSLSGKTIIMCTTNGTKTVQMARGADQLYLGAFVNAGAVARKTGEQECDIVLACAGTQRTFSLEDTCCAGCLIALIKKIKKAELTDSAMAALAVYERYKNNLAYYLRGSKNGRVLLNNGHTADIEYCCTKDLLNLIPALLPPGYIAPLP